MFAVITRPALYIGTFPYGWKLILAILYIQLVRLMRSRGQIEFKTTMMIDVSFQVCRRDCSSSSKRPIYPKVSRLLKLQNRSVLPSVHEIEYQNQISDKTLTRNSGKLEPQVTSQTVLYNQATKSGGVLFCLYFIDGSLKEFYCFVQIKNLTQLKLLNLFNLFDSHI